MGNFSSFLSTIVIALTISFSPTIRLSSVFLISLHSPRSSSANDSRRRDRSEFIRRYLVEIIIAISEFARTSGLVDGSCARPSLLHSRESIGVKYRLIN